METSNIPRFFWISLSFCMVIATLGILGIALRSATVSIEIADAKITMSSVLADVKEIKSNLEFENQSLLKEKEALENLLSELKQPQNNPQKILQTFLSDFTVEYKSFERTNRLQNLNNKINSMDKLLQRQ